jgi:hypothetical protein
MTSWRDRVATGRFGVRFYQRQTGEMVRGPSARYQDGSDCPLVQLSPQQLMWWRGLRVEKPEAP